MKIPVFAVSSIFAMGILLALLGIVSADVLPDAVPETQGISVTTSVIILRGSLIHSDDLVWQMTTGPALNSPPLGANPLTVDINGNPFSVYGLTGSGETASVSAYRENLNAMDGKIAFQKTLTFDTSNQVAIGDNLKVSKVMEFTSIPGAASRVVDDEEAMIDNMGQSQATGNVMLCPFGAGANAMIPAFCNRVTMGSSLDMTDVSVATELFLRSAAATADVPASIRYTINVKGPQSTATGGTPSVAKGTVTARMNAHIMEGRVFGPIAIPAAGGMGIFMVSNEPSEDIQYSTETTATGEITQFVKSMSYESGMRR